MNDRLMFVDGVVLAVVAFLRKRSAGGPSLGEVLLVAMKISVIFRYLGSFVSLE